MVHRRGAVGIPAFVAAIVVTAVVVAAAIFTAAPFSTTVTKTVPEVTTSTATTTVTITSTVASTNTSTYCVQTGIHGSLYVRVVSNSTNQPVSGANVTATIINYCTPNYQTNLGLTNSTGYSDELDWTGNFTMSVVYAGTDYTFPASTSSAVSLVTLSIPSGVAVENTIACYGLGCQNNTTTVTASSSSFSTITTSETAALQRSGPISTYPAAWSIMSSCPGFAKTGNTTTQTALPTAYPNSWNTTTVVTLDQVYQDIISSSAFASIAPGHGWVVYSWGFIQGGNSVIPPNSNDIVGYFILTNTTSPNGYVTAYYNIQTGTVALSSLAATVTVSCPTFTTSSSSTVAS